MSHTLYVPISLPTLKKIVHAYDALDTFAKAQMARAEQAEHRVGELKEALAGSVDVIKGWHNMDGSDEATWKIYYENAPEMKRIQAALKEPQR